MDRQGANEVFRELKVLWPIRFPESMSEDKAKATVDFIEESFLEYAPKTVVTACRNLARASNVIPAWAEIKAAADKVKQQNRPPGRKQVSALTSDDDGWLYAIYTDGSCDWIYNGRTRRWRNAACQEKAERILSHPSWESWVRQNFPKWASPELLKKYEGEIEKQMEIDRRSK